MNYDNFTQTLTVWWAFSYARKEAIFMWNLITHFLIFTGGMSAGVVLMCLLQAGKQADEQMEEMQRRDRINECGCDEGTV